MAALPQFEIKQGNVPAFVLALENEGFVVKLEKEMRIETESVHYREWSAESSEHLRLIFWTKCNLEEKAGFDFDVLSIGSPDGRRGRATLAKAIAILERIGARKL